MRVKIGAAQVAFINTPSLKLDFTDAVSIADFGLIDNAIRKVILNIIASMAVLPNRFLVKLDASNDYFQTYQHHLGLVRLTVGSAMGISRPEKSGAKKLFAKLVKDVPDCFCKVNVGAEDPWKTSTKDNSHDPEWNETRDFLVMDFDQCITVDVQDEDLGGDDDIGIGTTTVKQLLLAKGSQELALTHKGQPTSAKLGIHAKFYHFVSDSASFSAEENQGKDLICGMATVLIASALGLTGQRDDLNPSVKVSWAGKEFSTVVKTYSPGTDIFNPSFDAAFRIPLMVEMVKNPAAFKITLMNKTAESGSVEIPFADVLGAPGMVLEQNLDVGSGATVRANISLRGIQQAQ
jgi:Ca2+-dependent lipid-binding protein